MSEKRFNLSNPTNYRPIPKYIMIIHDDLEHRHLNVDDIVSLLNELAEENEQLRKEKESWKNIACQDLSKWSIFSNEVSVLHETRDIERFLEKYYEYCADMVMNDE